MYWHYAEPGDNFLGRLLSGLNALESTFNILPPHFKSTAPLDDEYIREEMDLMYGKIILKWYESDRDPTGLLLRFLAIIVYQFDWIKSIAQLLTNHHFRGITLIFKPELVAALKTKVTTKPSSVIKNATGIPTHVENSLNLQNLLSVANESLTLLRKQVLDIKKGSLISNIYYVLLL